MLLSNKGILPIPWELFPHHPNLLECYFGAPRQTSDYVKKPLLSREGANLTLHQGGAVKTTSGPMAKKVSPTKPRRLSPNATTPFPLSAAG